MLGIDYGLRRIGTAYSDSKGLVATPCRTVYLPKTGNLEPVFEDLKKILIEFNIKTILLGLPQAFETNHTEIQNRILSFKILLEEKFKIDVITYDESYSSKQAQNMLLSFGQHVKKTKSIIDNYACATFLQEFLNSQNEK